MIKQRYFKLGSKVILYITLCIMAFLSLFPVLFTLFASFQTQVELFRNMFPFTIRSLIPTSFTLGNYIGIFVEYNFWRPVFNTLFVTVVTIFLSCLFNSIASFAYTCFNFKGRFIFYGLSLISFMVPFEAIAIPLYTVANKLKMINTYGGMIIPAVADGLVIFLFIQFFKDLPKSLIDAALVDGASWVTIYVRILIPIAIPVFITAGLMVFMSQWNSYMWPLLVARSKEIRTIQISISEFTGEYTVRWTYIYAASVISAIIPISLFLPFQRYFIDGITAGSVKG